MTPTRGAVEKLHSFQQLLEAVTSLVREPADKLAVINSFLKRFWAD